MFNLSCCQLYECLATEGMRLVDLAIHQKFLGAFVQLRRDLEVSGFARWTGGLYQCVNELLYRVTRHYLSVFCKKATVGNQTILSVSSWLAYILNRSSL